jgi:hypothetical protein
MPDKRFLSGGANERRRLRCEIRNDGFRKLTFVVPGGIGAWNSLRGGAFRRVHRPARWPAQRALPTRGPPSQFGLRDADHVRSWNSPTRALLIEPSNRCAGDILETGRCHDDRRGIDSGHYATKTVCAGSASDGTHDENGRSSRQRGLTRVKAQGEKDNGCDCR